MAVLTTAQVRVCVTRVCVAAMQDGQAPSATYHSVQTTARVMGSVISAQRAVTAH